MTHNSILALESNSKISLSNSLKVMPLELFLKEKKQKYPDFINFICLLIIEYPCLRYLFLFTAIGDVFFDTEKENLLSLLNSCEPKGATYNSRCGELYLFPEARMYGNSFRDILLFFDNMMDSG